MKQNGAATLLMALVLMMSATIITLAVTRSHIAEQRISSNGNWHMQLRMAAEDGFGKGLSVLDDRFDSLVWEPLATGGERARVSLADDSTPAVHTEVVYTRNIAPGRFISIQSTALRDDRSGMKVRVSQHVRPLSVLTPAAESVPPLVLGGCLLLSAASFEIRPLNANSAAAGDAAWLDDTGSCPFPVGADLHAGLVRRREAGADLWLSIFSVSRLQMTDLATADRSAPARERRYWLADSSDLHAGRWNRSLGSARHPVVLYFPATTRCPEFGPGVQIHGLVFIDNDCPLPLASDNLEIYGSLVVNGNLNIHNTNLRLNHIQVADRHLTGLDFPPLRAVPVPGTWKDF